MLQARSLPDAFSIIKRRIQHIQTVSFDVFDTLLARRIHPPDIVHDRVAQRLASRIGHPSWQIVLQKRYEAVQQLRETASRDGMDHECDIESILRQWVGLLGINDDLIDEILAYELQLEKNALFLQEGCYDLLHWLKEQNMTLYALSDIYLNSSCVRQLLDHLDISYFFAGIYSSADRKLCKYSSRLFKWLCEEHRIDPRGHLHVGDNRVSDFLAPRKIGMQAIQLHDPKSIVRRAQLQGQKLLCERRSVFKGRYFYQVLNGGKTPEFSNFYERYGYEILGPIFSLFGLGLIERLAKKDHDSICFVARDGYLLQEIATRFVNAGCADSSLLRKFKYLYLSRKASFAAMAADGLTVEQARVGLYSPAQRGLESILKTFSLSVAPFQEVAQMHGLREMEQPIYDFFDQRLIDFFADPAVQKLIQEQNRKYKADLIGYLTGQGFFNAKRVALIDIGWNGSIQYSLHKLTEHISDRPVVDGYYLAYSSGIGYQMPENWLSDGIIYDEVRKHPGERSAIHFEEIFEEAARSLEGSTIGYDMHAEIDCFQPVFKPEDSIERLEERKRDPEILNLQHGVLAGLDRFIETVGLTGFSFQEIKSFFIYHLERALVYPTSNEVFHLSKLTHANDLGLNMIMDLESIRTRRSSVFQFRRFLTEVSGSEWTYGKMTGLWFNFPRYVMRVRELSRLGEHA